MNVFATGKAGENAASTGICIISYLSHSICISLTGKAIVKVLKAVTTSDVVLEVLAMSIKDFLCLEELGLSCQNLKHVSAVGPRDEVEVHLV